MCRPRRLGWLLLAAVALHALPAAGQETRFRLEGLTPGGGRTSVTEAWGTLQFGVTNFDPQPRDLRVLVFYPEQPDVQYGRDVWVPGQSRISGWVTVGPAQAQASAAGREIQFLLYDRTEGEARAVAHTGDGRLRSRAVRYQKREPTTGIILDTDPDSGAIMPPPGTPAADALTLARTFRHARRLSEIVNVIPEKFLSAAPEAFDGIDHLVLSGDRLAADPVGRRAIRHWVEQGGTLWVMLDQLDPATIGPILGDDRGFEVVGRTGLTTVRLAWPGDDPAQVPAHNLDVPVPFVRVALGGTETVLFEADGWPAAFVQSLGRGKVFVTTIGGAAWHRPREAKEARVPFEHYPDLPVPLPPLNRLALVIHPEPQPPAFQPADLAPLVTADIGYSVISRGTAALVLGGFALGLLAVGLVVRRSRRPGLAGWLTPAVAAVAAGLLVALGAARREAVPPTTAVATILDVAPGGEEAGATGLFAVYRPASGPVEVSADRGGRLDLDAAGLEGQTRRRVQTDLSAWHWEGLAFPAGVRTGPFRTSVPTGPVRAVARFGPDGLTGRLAAGRFRDPADAVLLTQAGEPVVVRLGADGSVASGPADALPAGRFLGGAVLTDQQQRRQDVYRRLLARPVARHLEGRDLLFVWAESTDPPFAAAGTERSVSSVLLSVPVEFERPAAGERVTIPAGFVPYVGVNQDGKPLRPTTEATQAVRQRFRFRLPPSVLPLTVERATLQVRVRASSRKVTVVGYAGGERARLAEVESPIDPIRVDVADPRLVTPDADGNLYLGVEVGERLAGSGDEKQAELDEKWRLESITLEVVGRTGR